jgi:hypothetical protein
MTETLGASVPDITLDMLQELLQVPEHESRRELIRRARLVSPQLPQLIISAAAREGVTLGTGTRDELRRARQRARRYEELYDAVRDTVAVRLVKGPSLARWYPADLVRPVGDLDLVVTDEEQLWRAARTIRDRAPVDRVDLALEPHAGGTALTVGLLWPSEDELLDRPLDIEITTLPFPGDLGGVVPPRTTLPTDQNLADILSLAEERFQREFNAKDAVDVLMLLAHCPPDPAALAEAARGHHLAPELRELLAYTRERTGATLLDAFTGPLRESAEAELTRRAAERREPPADAPDTVDGRLLAGLPVQGMMLRRVTDWTGPLRARRREVDGVTLLHTPVADFLLVTEEIVTRDDYDTALRAVDRPEDAR